MFIVYRSPKGICMDTGNRSKQGRETDEALRILLQFHSDEYEIAHEFPPILTNDSIASGLTQ
jgi:hypothetical protein